MIKKVTIHNFKCILDATVEMTYAEGRAPSGWKDLPLHPFIENGKQRDDRICPVLALYGANASGKTSILAAISILQKVVSNGISLRDGESLYKPNRIVSGKDSEPSDFEIEFWKDNSKYKYYLSYKNDQIVDEKLYWNDEKIFECRDGHLISNFGDIAERTFFTICISAKTKLQIKTFLGEASRSLPGLSKKLLAAEEFLVKDIVFLRRNSVHFSTGVQILEQTFEGSHEAQKEKALQEILKWLQKLDFRVVGLDLDDSKKLSDLIPGLEKVFAQNETINQTIYSMTTVHKTDSGNNVSFSLDVESEGTKRLVGLLGVILEAIKNGKVLLIDEIDQSLHSLILIELFRLFKEKRINTNKSQLICTVHNTDLLCSELLSLSEIGIVSQGRFDGSHILRLSSIDGLKNANGFRTRYLRGDFGGIPFPYI
jgi:AAA15 family ATPase/GTPase